MLKEPKTARKNNVGVGENIARFRRNKGWTQTELAEAAGISVSYISALEEEREHPRVRTLVIIAKCLGVTTSTLLSKGDD